jgi:hypothetical protein
MYYLWKFHIFQKDVGIFLSALNTHVYKKIKIYFRVFRYTTE